MGKRHGLNTHRSQISCAFKIVTSGSYTINIVYRSTDKAFPCANLSSKGTSIAIKQTVEKAPLRQYGIGKARFNDNSPRASVSLTSCDSIRHKKGFLEVLSSINL